MTTIADDRRERRELVAVALERAAGLGHVLSLGCVARIGARMPAWAPRRGARCQATPTYFPGFMIAGKLVVLPLCVVHHDKLERSGDQARLAREWAP